MHKHQHSTVSTQLPLPTLCHRVAFDCCSQAFCPFAKQIATNYTAAAIITAPNTHTVPDLCANQTPLISHTCCQQVLYSLDSQESVRVLRFPDAIKEDGQVVVVVKLVQVNLRDGDNSTYATGAQSQCAGRLAQGKQLCAWPARSADQCCQQLVSR